MEQDASLQDSDRLLLILRSSLQPTTSLLHQTAEPHKDTFRSTMPAFPWHPATGEQPDGYYHASTHLPDGRLGILVDPGAWTNIGGKSNVRRAAEAAVAAGHEPKQKKMQKPLTIQGRRLAPGGRFLDSLAIVCLVTKHRFPKRAAMVVIQSAKCPSATCHSGTHAS